MPRKFPPIFLAFTVGIACISRQAAATESIAPSSSSTQLQVPWAYEQSDIKPDSRVLWGRLDNGLRYAILRHPIPLNRASVVLLVQAGSFHENDDELGYAHFVEHMAFRDTRDFPKDEAIQALQRLGLQFGAHTNAQTSFFETYYRLDDLPTDNPEAVPIGLKILRSMADGVLFLNSVVKRERGVVLSEMKSAEGHLSTHLWPDKLEFLPPEDTSPSFGELRAVFSTTRLPERLPIGNEDTLNNATPGKLRAFYDRFYRPDRMILAVVGDITPGAAEQLVQQTFSGLKARQPKPADLAIDMPAPHPDAPAIIVNDFSGKAAMQHVSFCSSLAQGGPDNESQRRQMLCHRVTLALLSLRLQRAVSQPSSSLTSTETQLSHYVPGQEIASFGADCKPDQWAKAIIALDAQLRRACETGFSNNELKYATSMEHLRSAKEAIAIINEASGVLAGSLAFSIARDVVFDSSKTELEATKARLASLSTAECSAALKELFATSRLSIFLSGPFPAIAPTKEEVEKILHESRAQTLAPEEKSTTTASEPFPFTEFGTAGTISKQEHNAVLDAELIQFANGVRLNLKPTQFEVGRVHFVVNFGGGDLSGPLEKPGLALRSVIAWMLSGQEGLSYENGLSITGPSGNLNFSADLASFKISCLTSRHFLLLHLQNAAAHFTHPALVENAWNKALDGLRDMLSENEATASGVSNSALLERLLNHHPALTPSLEVISQRTLAEGKAWFIPQLTTTPIEITIVGAFDPKEATQFVASTFGTLRPRAPGDPYADQRRVKFPSRRFSDTVNFKGPKSVAIAQFAWPTPEITTPPDRLRGMILAAILEDRLRLKVRVEQGATYSLSASYQFVGGLNPAPGFFVCGVETDPEKAELVATTTRQVAAKLAREGATAEEFERARQPMIRENESDFRSNEWWISTLVGSQFDIKVAESSAQKDILLKSITLDEVNAMAGKLLLANRRSGLIVTPVLDASDYGNKGLSKLVKNDYPGAIAEYDQAIKLDPKQFDYYEHRGDAKEMLHDEHGAVADYNRALKLDPKSDRAYSGRGIAYAALKQYPEALEDYSKAIELKPDRADYFNLRGLCKKEQGDHSSAIADYDYAITLNPNVATYYHSRSEIKSSQDDSAGAISDLTSAIKLEPTENLYFRLRGNVKYIAGDFEGAIDDYNHVISLAGDHAAYSRFYRFLLLCRLQRGDPVNELKVVIHTWKTENWIRTIGLFLVGDLPENDFLAAAAKGDPKKVTGQKCEAFYFIGMLHLTRNETELAKDSFEKCVATKSLRYNEYTFSQAELRLLQNKRL